MCRELLAAGADPDRALAIYRSGVLALRIRSSREGASLTVEDAESDTPTRQPGDTAGAAPDPRYEQEAAGATQ